uniref:Steroid 21-hydroxylase n=1 Tax=Chrysemys picta bellii TaxID=8478 RepID=A0A8C3HDX8_CHRPI
MGVSVHGVPPQVQDGIHAELHRVLGPERPPSYGDRDRLPLLSATISETLRLRPVAPLALPHSTTRDTSLLGFTIPKGTTVIPNLFAAHHDEGTWSRPLEFRPERFLEADDPRLAQRNLLPFSCGARACLGETLARAEIFVFLGHVLREFRLEPPAPGALPALRGVYGTVMRCPPFRVRFLPWGPPIVPLSPPRDPIVPPSALPCPLPAPGGPPIVPQCPHSPPTCPSMSASCPGAPYSP